MNSLTHFLCESYISSYHLLVDCMQLEQSRRSAKAVRRLLPRHYFPLGPHFSTYLPNSMQETREWKVKLKYAIDLLDY